MVISWIFVDFQQLIKSCYVYSYSKINTMRKLFILFRINALKGVYPHFFRFNIVCVKQELKIKSHKYYLIKLPVYFDFFCEWWLCQLNGQFIFLICKYEYNYEPNHNLFIKQLIDKLLNSTELMLPSSVILCWVWTICNKILELFLGLSMIKGINSL